MKALYPFAWVLFAVLFSVNAHAQTNYGFTYDTSGNRLTRAVIFLKSATIPGDSLQTKKVQEILDDQIGLQKACIYPNPTKGLLKIDLPSLNDQDATLRVFDQTGRQIINKSVISIGNEVDMSACPSGFYIMVISIGKEKKEWKIIKE